MAGIGAILKALATWQPTSGLSRQQLAQDFGQSSRFATFDQQPNRAPVVNADVPPEAPGLSMIDNTPQYNQPQQTGMNLMGGGQEQAEVKPFVPQELPEGQELPPQTLAAALSNPAPWERAYSGAPHQPMPWEAPMHRVNLGNINVTGTGEPENPEFDWVGELNQPYNQEDDMMRKSREFQDMLVNLIMRNRGQL